MSNFSNKTNAREFTFKFIYNILNSAPDLINLVSTKSPKEDYEQLFEEFLSSYTEPDSEHPNNQVTNNAKSFALILIEGILSNKDALEDKISPLLHKRKIHQLEKIDYTILMLGSFEILNIKDTPKNVVIDEMVNLAKKFGTADSYSFINGTLDSLK
ncbi:transcription antitermination factor NusB [Halobacteriovorax sp. HLS]|uniref:transcription antitermination factor NusB n=1 Tax=Halobacteriovorax sp. HLS TaxID=2234000 RepID=UPI0013E3588B|nr:transcription antitermination factor NusB [Halobacteriovorax sp. HLS]